MRSIKRRAALVTALLGAVLCAGLLTGCKDLIHPEGPTEYTITFDAENGSFGYFKKVTVQHGDSAGSAMPSNPTKSGYAFGGWYTARNGGGAAFTAATPVTGNVTVYAKWTEAAPVPTSTLQSALTWLASNAVSGAAYTITLGADEDLAPASLSYSGKTVSISIDGGTAERTVSLSSSGSLFTVNSGVTLTLGNNLTLRGRSGNTSPLVRVNAGGTLAMESGSKISGNISSSGYGGGVYVGGGTFTMSGGEISGNTASNGGGVFVNSGTFTKQAGGTIYGANASDTLKNTATNGANYGHAVYVSSSKIRHTTAGFGVTLDSGVSGAAGGWETLYTVSYSANGGSGTAPSAQTAVSGTAATLASGSGLTKTGHTFSGWNTNSSGTGTSYAAGAAFTVTANVTLYAVWIPQYTITFDADGGTPDTQTKTVSGSDSTIGVENMPAEPAKSGYAFEGWWTVANGGGTAFTGTTTVIGNIRVYARWTAQYTVSFDADGGNPAAQTRTVISGSSIGAANMPAEPAKSDGTFFDGWWTAANGGGTAFTDTTTVSGDITVYAKWNALPSGLSLEESLTWISDNAVENGVYTITLRDDEAIAPQTLSYDGKTVSITLNADGTERVIILKANGSLFTVNSGVTLTLNDKVAVQGRSGNTASLVLVNSGGALVMNSGARLTGNITSSSYYASGGGVHVASNGTFTMNGGTISGNVASYSYAVGGGVFVVKNGTFTMSGGEISGNTSSAGGGVYSEGTFTMSGGEISGNTSSYGGGVYSEGTFTMENGTISGNTASYDGGGVFVGSGTFNKQYLGVIYGSDASDTLKNTANDISCGPAVYVDSGSKRRNTTAGRGVILNSSISGSAGGWDWE